MLRTVWKILLSLRKEYSIFKNVLTMDQKKTRRERRIKRWHEKTLHGQFMRETENVHRYCGATFSLLLFCLGLLWSD